MRTFAKAGNDERGRMNIERPTSNAEGKVGEVPCHQ
jgi:hypothetical protein